MKDTLILLAIAGLIGLSLYYIDTRRAPLVSITPPPTMKSDTPPVAKLIHKPSRQVKKEEPTIPHAFSTLNKNNAQSKTQKWVSGIPTEVIRSPHHPKTLQISKNRVFQPHDEKLQVYLGCLAIRSDNKNEESLSESECNKVLAQKRSRNTSPLY